MAVILNATTASGLQVSSDNSGVIQFQQNGSNTVTIPAGTGTAAVQGVSTNIVSGTAVATTSGTSFTFTSIPSWVKRITVMFQGVGTNASSSTPIIQIGSGGVTTTGYLSVSAWGANASNTTLTAVTTGFSAGIGNATSTRHGTIVLSLLSGNTWVASGTLYDSTGGRINWTAGSISLAGVLDRIVLTTLNGTDAFNAGSINILYE